MKQRDITQPSESLYLVSRTRNYGDYDESPCEEAVQINIVYTDIRNADSTDKIPALKNNPEKWYGAGFDHRVIDGKYIARSIVVKQWSVRINNMSDLNEFIKRHGRVILDVNESGYNTIEIYDGYRE